MDLSWESASQMVLFVFLGESHKNTILDNTILFWTTQANKMHMHMLSKYKPLSTPNARHY